MSKVMGKYLADICSIYKKGDAREETYYGCLKDLFEKIAKRSKLSINITILPKKIEGGCPDFRVWDGTLKNIGYIYDQPPLLGPVVS